MDAIMLGLITVFIFGGGYFLITLIRFTVSDIRSRHHRHVYARRIADSAYRAFVDHI